MQNIGIINKSKYEEIVQNTYLMIGWDKGFLGTEPVEKLE